MVRTGSTGVRARGQSSNGGVGGNQGTAMGLDVYGGNPVVVANYNELVRVSKALQLAASNLDHARFAGVGFSIAELGPQIQLSMLLPGLVDRVKDLAIKAEMAADAYFSAESRVVGLINQVLSPLSTLSTYMGQPIAIMDGSTKLLANLGAIFAVAGLTGKANLAKTAMVAGSIRMTTAAFGYNSAQHLLGEQQANLKLAQVKLDVNGSAKLVTLSKVSSVNAIGDHAAAVAKAYDKPGSRILIDVYKNGYGRNIVVYIPGTQSLNFGGENPLNIRSNLTAFGGLEKSPTQSAIDSALSQLKTGPSDSVLLVGHSQGALVGAQMATSEQPYQVAGLISFGGPISQFGLEVPVISLQNHGDPVPHLSGQVNPLASNWVTASNPGEYASVIDAHKMASYVDSARELDQSDDPGFRRIHEQIGIQPNKPGMRYVFELSRD